MISPMRMRLLASSIIIGHNFVYYNSAQCQEHDLKAFSPKEFRSYPVSKITALSHNVKAYEIALPTKEHETGVTVSSLIMVKGVTYPDGKFDVKPYTPTSLNDQKGSMELVVKTYPEGKVSGFMNNLKVGDMIDIKGPFPKLPYIANMKKEIGMLCGGTGITPMLQVIKEVLKNPEDKTEISLVFANTTEDDILLKSRIDELAAKHANFKVTYVLSSPPTSGWSGETGFISSSIICSVMPKPSTDSLILVCGPPGFMAAMSGDKTKDYKQGMVEGLLKAAGYNEDMVFKF